MYNLDSQTAMCKMGNDRTSDSGERIRIEEMEKANESSWSDWNPSFILHISD